MPDDAGGSAPREFRESPYRATPVRLDDIDRLLEQTSVDTARAGGAPVRAWRDDLALVLEALRYARVVLTGDAAILRRALAGPPGMDDLVDELPTVLGARSRDTERPEPEGPAPDFDLDSDIDLDVVTRADDLVSVHEELAGLDFSDAGNVTRVLDLVEDTLVAVTAYQAAVELRLREIRAVILRQYVERGAAFRPGSG